MGDTTGAWLYSRKQEGSGASGTRVLSVMCCRTDRWVPPTERAGSEGVIEYRGADRFPPNTRHPERKRRISVHGVSDSWGSTYQVGGKTSDILHSRKQKGSGAFRRPGSSRHRACRPLDGYGSARRAGWFRRSYKAACWRQPRSGYKTHRP